LVVLIDDHNGSPGQNIIGNPVPDRSRYVLETIQYQWRILHESINVISPRSPFSIGGKISTAVPYIINKGKIIEGTVHGPAHVHHGLVIIVKGDFCGKYIQATQSLVPIGRE